MTPGDKDPAASSCVAVPTESVAPSNTAGAQDDNKDTVSDAHKVRCTHESTRSERGVMGLF